MLKSVNVLFLSFKRINLSFVNMGRLILICLVAVGMGLLSSCSKPLTDTQQIRAQAIIDSTIIYNYLASNSLLGVAKKDASGEYYIVDTLGTGTALFTGSTLVTVGYTGRVLGSTTNFASTTNFHPSYILGDVIQGWQIGIPHIKKGGTIRLIIPSQYGYGIYPQTALGIPANAVLDFTIKLYDIIN